MDRASGGVGESEKFRSYLLRLWLEDEPGRTWRASLESATSGERRGFGSLDELFNYLRRQTGGQSDSSADRYVGIERR